MKESTLAPHQERVVIEKQELVNKLYALGTFLEDENRTAIPKDEEARLRKQQIIMADYVDILVQRINEF